MTVGFTVLALFCSGGLGCSSTDDKQTVEFVTLLPPGTTVAVAPPINASGSTAIDTLKVGDLMASELSGFDGIGVIGVNRVLAILAEQGLDRVQSTEHALEVCHRLGADAIIVFALTEYDPYTPVVGMVAELYGERDDQPQLDPVATSRMARPFPVAPPSDSQRPWSMVQRTFNAEHQTVLDDVKAYAAKRDGNESPFGWKRYTASQEYFLRFCCFNVARDLMQ